MIINMVGLATIVITVIGGALAFGSLIEENSSRRVRRLGSNSGIITGIGCAAFCGWRIFVEIDAFRIGDEDIFRRRMHAACDCDAGRRRTSRSCAICRAAAERAIARRMGA